MLSASGRRKVEAIIALESVLRELESRPGRVAEHRDPERYWLQITNAMKLRKNFALVAAGAAGPSKEEMARLEARNKAAKLYNQAAKAYDENDLDEAAEGFHAAVAEDPELALGWAALAQVELERENWEGALDADIVRLRRAGPASSQ